VRTSSRALPIPLLASFFVGSGFSALAYQVILSRYAQLIVGATAYAVSAILVAFMLGMSAGSAVGGRLSDRTEHPLRLYALAEAAIGLYCVSFPLFYPRLLELYLSVVPTIGESSLVARNLVRFLFGVAAFLVPTFFMGITTPAFARAVASGRADSGAWLARLYGWNTLGAALGALATAYILVPELGLVGSMLLAASINFAIALAAFRGSQPVPIRERAEAEAPEDIPPDAPARASSPPAAPPKQGDVLGTSISPRWVGGGVAALAVLAIVDWRVDGIDLVASLLVLVQRRFVAIAFALAAVVVVAVSGRRGGAASRLLRSATAVYLLAAFASGFLSFALEVIWTHLLAVLLGNSVYAFGLMLGSLLLGLAIGTLFARRLSGSERRARNAIGISLALAGLSVLGTLEVWDEIPRVFLFLADRSPSFALLEGVRFFVALGLMLLPTAAFGTTFPLILHCASWRGGAFGRNVGQVYSVNTIGAVLGALSGPYVFLPVLGSLRSLETLGALLLAAGGLALLALSDFPRRRAMALAAVSAVVWAPMLPVSWDFNRLNMAAAVYLGDSASAKGEILYRREDATGGLTSVVEERGVRTLLTNGKFQGDNAEEIPIQHRAANIPTLFTAGRDRALVIGLGTGVTLAALAAHGFDEVVCAELSKPIIEAAGGYFSDVNGRILESKRLRLIEEDGRSVLLESPDRYDVVTVEVSSIWFAGVGSIYSQEFYRLAAAKLRRQGVLLQWFPIHHLSARNLYMVVNTVRSVFPHVSLWTHRHQAFVVASNEPLKLDLDSIRSDMGRESMAPYLRELPSGSPVELLSDLVVTDSDIDRFLDSMAVLLRVRRSVVSTDTWPTLEYETPKDVLENFSYFQNRATFRRFRSVEPFEYRGLPTPGERVLGLAAFSRGWNDPRAVPRLARAFRERPDISDASSQWLYDELTGEDAFGTNFPFDPARELGAELDSVAAMLRSSESESSCEPLPRFVSRVGTVPLQVVSYAGESLDGTAPGDAIDGIYDPELDKGWRARPEGRPVLLELGVASPLRIERIHLVVRAIDGAIARTRLLGRDESGVWHPIASGSGHGEIACDESRVFRLSDRTPRLDRIRVEVQGEGSSFRIALHEIWVEARGEPAS
jgi:spermidine synthase